RAYAAPFLPPRGLGAAMRRASGRAPGESGSLGDRIVDALLLLDRSLLDHVLHAAGALERVAWRGRRRLFGLGSARCRRMPCPGRVVDQSIRLERAARREGNDDEGEQDEDEPHPPPLLIARRHRLSPAVAKMASIPSPPWRISCVSGRRACFS